MSVVEDIPFYLDLAEARRAELGGRALQILELGAGSGRITIPLALRGHSVTALDIATGQLERLAARGAESGLAERITIVDADMRALPTLDAAPFDLVIAPFRSLLHVASEAAAVFARVREQMHTGAALAFDVFHPHPEESGEVHDRWLLRRRTDSAQPPGMWSIWERAVFDHTAQTLTLDVRCDFRAAAGFTPSLSTQLPKTRSATMHLHTPAPQHWREALEQAGFALESVYGWFDGEPFEPGDEDSVWVARSS